MLIDDFIANPDAAERHSITIAAPAPEVYRTLKHLDLRKLFIVRLLMTVREIPAFLAHRRTRPDMVGPLTLDSLATVGFGRLAELPGRELVLGVTGRFWRPVGDILPFAEESFSAPLPPGYGRAVWNFAIEEKDGASVLTTETRVICADRSSRRKFRVYWVLVKPVSGLIRRLMLRSVRLACEDTA